MFKDTLLAAALVFAVSSTAFAGDMMKCDNASMMKMQEHMDMMKDPAMKPKKDMAMKEMDMAKMSMKAKKMKDCSMHMDKAAKAMKG